MRVWSLLIVTYTSDTPMQVYVKRHRDEITEILREKADDLEGKRARSITEEGILHLLSDYGFHVSIEEHHV